METVTTLTITEEKKLDDFFNLAGLMDDSEYVLKWNGEHKELLKKDTEFSPLWNPRDCVARVERARRFEDMTLLDKRIEVEKFFISLIDEKARTEKDRTKRVELLKIQKVSEDCLEKLRSFKNM